MKICKSTRVLGLLGALALGTTIASAATAVDLFRVNVPFAFVLGGKVLPAGEYVIHETDSGIIEVQGEGTSVIALTIPAEPSKANTQPSLRFTSNNGHEFLVAVDSEVTSRAVPIHTYEVRSLTQSH